MPIFPAEISQISNLIYYLTHKVHTKLYSDKRLNLLPNTVAFVPCKSENPISLS